MFTYHYQKATYLSQSNAKIVRALLHTTFFFKSFLTPATFEFSLGLYNMKKKRILSLRKAETSAGNQPHRQKNKATNHFVEQTTINVGSLAFSIYGHSKTKRNFSNQNNKLCKNMWLHNRPELPIFDEQGILFYEAFFLPVFIVDIKKNLTAWMHGIFAPPINQSSQVLTHKKSRFWKRTNIFCSWLHFSLPWNYES